MATQQIRDALADGIFALDLAIELLSECEYDDKEPWHIERLKESREQQYTAWRSMK